MKWAIREAVDVYFKAKSVFKLGARTMRKGEPILIFDTVKTSTLEVGSEVSYVTGGRGNARLLSYEGDKTLTFQFEDALLSNEGLAILSGADLIPARNKNLPGAHPDARSVISHYTEKYSVVTGNLIDNDKTNTYADDPSLYPAADQSNEKRWDYSPRGGELNVWLSRKPYVGQNSDIYVMLLDDSGEMSGAPLQINLSNNSHIKHQYTPYNFTTSGTTSGQAALESLWEEGAKQLPGINGATSSWGVSLASSIGRITGNLDNIATLFADESSNVTIPITVSTAKPATVTTEAVAAPTAATGFAGSYSTTSHTGYAPFKFDLGNSSGYILKFISSSSSGIAQVATSGTNVIVYATVGTGATENKTETFELYKGSVSSTNLIATIVLGHPSGSTFVNSDGILKDNAPGLGSMATQTVTLVKPTNSTASATDIINSLNGKLNWRAYDILATVLADSRNWSETQLRAAFSGTDSLPDRDISKSYLGKFYTGDKFVAFFSNGKPIGNPQIYIKTNSNGEVVLNKLDNVSAEVVAFDPRKHYKDSLGDAPTPADIAKWDDPVKAWGDVAGTAAEARNGILLGYFSEDEAWPDPMGTGQSTWGNSTVARGGENRIYNTFDGHLWGHGYYKQDAAVFDDQVAYYVDFESARKNWVSGWGPIELYTREITAATYLSGFKTTQNKLSIFAEMSIKNAVEEKDNQSNRNGYSYLLAPSGGIAQPKCYKEGTQFVYKVNVPSILYQDIVLLDYYVEAQHNATQVTILPDKFGPYVYVEGSSLVRRASDGMDLPVEFVIPKLKITTSLNLTLQSTGDASTFSFQGDAYPDFSKFDLTRKVLADIQILDADDNYDGAEGDGATADPTSYRRYRYNEDTDGEYLWKDPSLEPHKNIDYSDSRYYIDTEGGPATRTEPTNKTGGLIDTARRGQAQRYGQPNQHEQLFIDGERGVTYGGTDDGTSNGANSWEAVIAVGDTEHIDGTPNSTFPDIHGYMPKGRGDYQQAFYGQNDNP